MISFENSAFLCLVVINLIGFISCFVIMSNQGLKKKFWKKFKLFMAIAYIGIGGAVITSILVGGGKHPENALQLMIILIFSIMLFNNNFS